MLLIKLFLLILACYCQAEDKKSVDSKNCRERNRLITSNKEDSYKIVDATIGQKLILQCHYCSENDDNQPKIWYKMDQLFNSSSKEVNLGMDSDSHFNRIRVNEFHSLIFHNITLDDRGFYYCLGLEGQEAENRYNYLVDIVFENEARSETGNLTTWRQYYEENLDPVNKLFSNSTIGDYIYARQNLLIKLEAFTEWDVWGACEVCGRPQGDGQKRMKGFCRIKVHKMQNSRAEPKNDDERFLINVRRISCKSIVLDRLFPEISNVTKYLPNFIQIEHCQGTCNPDSEGLGKGWKTGKSLGFKYKKSYVLAQDAHLTLVCPESTLENIITWRRNGKVLKPGKSVQSDNPNDEPKITVDTFNTLYLHSVTSKEEGNYTCQVDDIRMQQVRIFVVSKSRLLTQGLVVTWSKRHTFIGYEELVKSEEELADEIYEEDFV